MRDLLELLCRYPWDPSNRDALSRLIREVDDWHKAADLINAHGIIALAAYNIKESGLEKEVPEKALAFIKNGYRQSIVRNTWLTERWKEVNTILCNAGIKHILLKGMALEHTLYGSKGLRQMNDNDILVKPGEAIKAWHLLQQSGFSPELFKSPLHKMIITDSGKHLPTLYKEGYAVEIHHRLYENELTEEFSPDDLFVNAVEIDLSGVKAFILPPEVQMIYLVDHFDRHAREGSVQMRQYADILLLDKATTVKMPDNFISDPHQELKFKYRKAAYKINIRSMRPKHRLLYIAGDIFPSVTWMKERYSCSGIRAMIYYPVRLGKLLWLL